MSHGFPRHRKRDRRCKEKRPQLPQSKLTESIAVKAPTAGLIGELGQSLHALAFAEAIKELQSATKT
jgi:hypothetical protein